MPCSVCHSTRSGNCFGHRRATRFCIISSAFVDSRSVFTGKLSISCLPCTAGKIPGCSQQDKGMGAQRIKVFQPPKTQSFCLCACDCAQFSPPPSFLNRPSPSLSAPAQIPKRYPPVPSSDGHARFFCHSKPGGAVSIVQPQTFMPRILPSAGEYPVT